VVKTADDGSYQVADLGSPNGTIYVRATDNNRGLFSNRNDTLFVDHMFIDGGTPVSFPPQAPTVTINISNTNDVELSWPHVTSDVDGGPVMVNRYQVYRSTEPHSTPITPTWTLEGPLTEPIVHLDAGLIGDPDVNYYYTVVAVARDPFCLDLPSDSPSRSGSFGFALVPGD
jgi:hypothetical protein